MTILPGHYCPLGASYDGNGVNFAIFSAHAEKVELCLFDDNDNEQRVVLPLRSGDVWHGYISGIELNQRYAYRIYGPWDPHNGLRFNPDKLLIDPYCLALDGMVKDSPLLQGGYDEPNNTDSVSVVPKCIVTDPVYDWQDERYPDIPWQHTIIYEAHVSGLTKLHPQIPQALRGSYAALSHPVMLEYFKRLGITAIELLPIQLHIDEPRLIRQGLNNYWGYNVLAPFAIEPRYWSGAAGTTPLSEFQDTVKALHQAGIEVILDVVFNHTAELDLFGPTLSLRGVDNKSYYWLDERGDYLNWSGCGNALNLTQKGSLQWVLDCLRFWREICHVDGFRFDLATILGRTPDFSANSHFFTILAQDPALAKCKLIAEPWDIAVGGYQLGQFPWPFAEWNDRFRDDIRQFWLTDSLSLATFACRFAASSDYFDHHGRLPFSSINKITSHDGFTLADLVSFNQKQNQANGEQNRDGNNQNYSNNHGVEGESNDQFVLYRRQKSQRALLTTLLLAQGTPLLLAGDEIGHSQHGNNNAYCQDNAITWLNWQTSQQSLIDFVSQLISLRKRIPALNGRDWWRRESREDVCWLNQQAEVLQGEGWHNQPQQVMMVQLSGKWLVVINATAQPQQFTLPTGDWRVVAPFNEEDAVCSSTSCCVAARCIGVLERTSQ